MTELVPSYITRIWNCQNIYYKHQTIFTNSISVLQTKIQIKSRIWLEGAFCSSNSLNESKEFYMWKNWIRCCHLTFQFYLSTIIQIVKYLLYLKQCASSFGRQSSRSFWPATRLLHGKLWASGILHVAKRSFQFLPSHLLTFFSVNWQWWQGTGLAILFCTWIFIMHGRNIFSIFYFSNQVCQGRV